MKKMYVEPMYFFNKYWEGVNWEKLEKVTSLLEDKNYFLLKDYLRRNRKKKLREEHLALLDRFGLGGLKGNRYALLNAQFFIDKIRRFLSMELLLSKSETEILNKIKWGLENLDEILYEIKHWDEPRAKYYVGGSGGEGHYANWNLD